MDINNLFTPTGQPTGNFQQDEYIYEAEHADISGLALSNPNTTAFTYYDNQNPEVQKAKAEAFGTEAGFKPPSNGQMLFDMLGGMLLGYGAARLLGADGKASLAIGLNAAGINHDKDQQEVERYGIIESSIKQNGMIYNPQSLWTFMKTGNGAAMEQEEREYFNAGQTSDNHDWQDQRLTKQQDYQKERQQAQFAQQNANREDNQAFQQGMQTERLNAKGGLGGYGNGYDASAMASILSTLNPSQRAMVKDSLSKAGQSVKSNVQRLSSYQNVQNLMNEYNDPNTPIARKQAIGKEIADDLYRGQHGGNATLPANSEELALPNIGYVGNMENKANLIKNGTFSKDMADAITNEANSSIADISHGVEQVKNNLVRQFIAQGISPANAEILAQSILSGADSNVLPESTPESKLDGSTSTAPEGETVVYNGVTYKTINGKWKAQ